MSWVFFSVFQNVLLSMYLPVYLRVFWSEIRSLCSFRLTVRLVVPNNSAGHIIGKGGETIQQLQASTMCNLKVGERDPNVAERIVSVRGAPEDVTAGASRDAVRHFPSYSGAGQTVSILVISGNYTHTDPRMLTKFCKYSTAGSMIKSEAPSRTAQAIRSWLACMRFGT